MFKKKVDGCKNNPKDWPITKVGEHIPSGFAMSAILSFKTMENKLNLYKHSMKKWVLKKTRNGHN